MKYVLLFISLLIGATLTTTKLCSQNISVQVPITSFHLLNNDLEFNPNIERYNKLNLGLIANYWFDQKQSVFVGFYRNSFYNYTYLLGYDRRIPISDKFSWGYMLSLAHGYNQYQPLDVIVIAGAYIAYFPTDRFNIKIGGNPVFIGLLLEYEIFK
jgi:hypothetical protein